MKIGLLLQAAAKFAAGVTMLGLLLFLPAGTWNYPDGWLFCGLLFIPMLVLGSQFAFMFFLVYPALLVKRIQNEEAVLEVGLPGYREYKKKVKYRLIPFIW